MRDDGPVFVAGAGGLLGSAFVRRLRREGGADLLTPGRRELDLTDQRATVDYFERRRPAVVVLAAGYVGGIQSNREFPADFIWRNLAIQTNVFQAALRSGVERLLFFGSSCMYPRDCAQPMREEDLCAGKPEETSVAYAVAKLAGVEMCLAFNRQYGAKRFLPLIPNTLYGPGDNFDPASSHVIPALIRRFHEAKATGAEAVALWGTGAARREAVYVDDAVDAALHVLRSDTGPMTFPMNIGSGEERSIRSLAELVGRIVGYAGDIVFDATKPDGAPRKSLDGSRLAAAGWNGPITPLEEGLRATYTWYRETGGARPPTAAERK